MDTNKHGKIKLSARLAGESGGKRTVEVRVSDTGVEIDFAKAIDFLPDFHDNNGGS